MRVLVAILFLAIASSWMLSPETWAQRVDAPGGQPQDSEAAKYWESLEKQRKLNMCLKLGRGDCYRKYQEAVDWCLKNWNECLPMIRHAGVYAGAYGEQIAEKCRKELEEKCRREAGP